MGSKQINMIGFRFGRLVVVDHSSSVKYGKSIKRTWKCVCDCGKTLICNTGALTSGNTKSCGCLHSEQSAKNGRKSRHLIAKKSAPLNIVFGSYRHAAKKRGLSFSITKQEFEKLINSKCFYCGDDYSNKYEYKTVQIESYRYNGVDRIDNNIGYEITNVVPCCKFCNHAKKNHSVEYFLERIKKIYDHNFGKQQHDTNQQSN